ncbi:MAG: RNA polymerase sigma-70 factor [Bacteroidetes bacterium]|nr:RNA polymerase sigma-70 factor [Bacteroidota bacterium]MBU1372115.1 RNA polymerase sigma-70 factor [Bacteroidota bacterium]MBU1484036.1 RNA polymerase sigma-70 factor [Bacteroidota bacterium]MBU1760902.1 RNA polymerase sigma-70 factor [Bacteroidota bacterium]MBU2045673.1 RNA polymerase sigma-70 factor [Bacteroidota bacterium]
MKIVFSLLDDEQLVAHLKNGDKVALDEIYYRNADFLFRYAYKRLNNEADVSDLIQDVFFKLWVKRDTLKIEGSLQAYLTYCLKNLIIDQFRHQKVKEQYQEFASQKKSYTTNTEDQIHYSDLKSSLQLKITQLPAKMQEIFVLRKMEEHSVKEIAEQLNLSPQTVKNQLVSAMLRLKMTFRY